MWEKLSRKFDLTTRDSKTRLQNKFPKRKPYAIRRYPKYWIIELEVIRGGRGTKIELPHRRYKNDEKYAIKFTSNI